MTDEDKEWWDEQVARHQANMQRPRFTEKTVVLIIFLVVLFFGGIGTCTYVRLQLPPDNLPAWDSTSENHSDSPITKSGRDSL